MTAVSLVNCGGGRVDPRGAGRAMTMEHPVCQRTLSRKLRGSPRDLRDREEVLRYCAAVIFNRLNAGSDPPECSPAPAARTAEAVNDLQL
jgi:hypothetical protein